MQKIEKIVWICLVICLVNGTFLLATEGGSEETARAAEKGEGPNVNDSGSVMLWMCLQRCGEDEAEIQRDLGQIAENEKLISSVSFEFYNLGPNSTLITNSDVSHVNGELLALGVRQRYAMISTYPHPPEMVGYMRQLWADPQPFTQACIAQIRRHGLSGLNVDLEPNGPQDGFTAQDAANYAAWLNQFTLDVRQATGALVQVDVATWSPLWNLTLIGQTAVDQVMTMSTYTTSWPSFQSQLQYALSTIPASKLVVGLQTTVLDPAQLQLRFDLLQQNHLSRIAIWSSPIPSSWFPFLTNFTHSAVSSSKYLN